MVDFVQRNDGRELLVCKGVDYALDGFVGPVLEGFFEAEAV